MQIFSLLSLLLLGCTYTSSQMEWLDSSDEDIEEYHDLYQNLRHLEEYPYSVGQPILPNQPGLDISTPFQIGELPYQRLLPDIPFPEYPPPPYRIIDDSPYAASYFNKPKKPPVPGPSKNRPLDELLNLIGKQHLDPSYYSYPVYPVQPQAPHKYSLLPKLAYSTPPQESYELPPVPDYPTLAVPGTYPIPPLVQAKYPQTYLRQTPTYPAPSPTYPTQPPAYSTAPPAYSTAPPAYSTAPPAYSTSPPAYSTSPPAYPTQRPTYSTAPPAYSTAPPAYSTAPPAYSTSPPNYPSLQKSGQKMSSEHLTEEIAKVVRQRRSLYYD